LITVALSATIGAPHERVWNALVDPAQRGAWDERVLGEVPVPRARSHSRARERGGADTATPLRETRWRFRLGTVPLVMHDRIMAADRGDRLVSRISIGSMHFDQTLTLHVDDDETGPRTRLGMKLVGSNSIAVIGEVVPRLDVQKMLIEYVDTTLRQIQKYCEASA
jgi:uncharacterized protein YndB with AHSA1/START domain